MLIETVKPIIQDATKQMRICEYVRKLYREIDERISSGDNVCENCKQCCNFEISGLDLFVSNIEFVYFLANVGQIKRSSGNICPYLDGQKGCMVREFRPIGCRTYFCKPAEGYSAGEIYEWGLNKIKSFVRENELPYGYYRWMEVLRSY